MNKLVEKIKENKIIIFIFTLLIFIIGSCIIADHVVSDYAKGSKNVNYYEQTGKFNNYVKDNNTMNKYNISKDEEKTLKELWGKAQDEIKKNNIISGDMYYRKKSELGEEYIVIRGNNIYIEVDSKGTTVKRGNEKMYITNETIAEYYDTIFEKAIKDTNYKKLIYFEDIKDLGL